MSTLLSTPAAQRQSYLRNLWTDPSAFATTLVVAFMDEYGPPIEVEERNLDDVEEEQDKDPEPSKLWTPETVLLTIQQDFDVDPPRSNFDRLYAGLQIATSDEFFAECDTFVAFCNVLAGSTLVHGVADLADVEECAWGVAEASLLARNQDEDLNIDPEITAYVQEMLKREGFIQVPQALRPVVGDWQPPVSGTFEDDPSLYGEMQAIQTARRDAVDYLVGKGLQLLVAQLRQLPLRRGTNTFLQKLFQSEDQ